MTEWVESVQVQDPLLEGDVVSSPALSVTVPLPALPHWESTPDDLPTAIREIKAALRTRIAASGRTVEEVFAVVERRVRAAVDEITTARQRGDDLAGHRLRRHRGRHGA